MALQRLDTFQTVRLAIFGEMLSLDEEKSDAPD
jgi:hypothetical protein